MSFKMVDTLTVVISDDGRKNTTIIRTSASAKMSQMKLVLNHFPLLDMGVPLLYQTSNQVRLPATRNISLFCAIIAYSSICLVIDSFHNYGPIQFELVPGPRPNLLHRQKVSGPRPLIEHTRAKRQQPE